jgi:glutamate racemase
MICVADGAVKVRLLGCEELVPCAESGRRQADNSELASYGTGRWPRAAQLNRRPQTQ